MRFRNLIAILLIGCSLAFTQDKTTDWSYPISFNLTWGGASTWSMIQFDWNVTPLLTIDTIRVKAARTLAGSSLSRKYFTVTGDQNQGEPLVQMGLIDTAWAVHYADGTLLIMPGTGGRYFVDITDYCPRITRSPYGNRRYNEMEADTLAYMANSELCDGVNSDGTWGYPYEVAGVDMHQIDLDRDSIADMSETSHGATASDRQKWIANAWAAGYNTLNARLRSKTGWANRLITAWTVCADPYGDTMGVHTFSGMGWENAPQNQPITFDIPYDAERIYGRQFYDAWNRATNIPTPRVMFLTATLYRERQNPECPTPYVSKASTWWRYARWTEAMAAQWKAAYCLQLWDGATTEPRDHAFNLRYDEFRADLGKPSSPDTVYSIRSGSVTVRFFDEGCIIRYSPLSNSTTASSVLIDTNDIKPLSGYNGPYYRMYSNMDTTTNNGAAYDTITMRATASSRALGYGEGWMQMIGDAIFLKRTRDTIMEPVIVDNSISGTTPGSDTARIVGTATYNSSDHSQSNPYYNTGGYPPGSGNVHYEYYCQKRLGSSTTDSAKFTPKLNRAGRWRVSEWHGHVISGTEVSNLPCRIWHAGGDTTVYIDQTNNYGQWNIIDTFPYTPTSNQTLAIAGTGSGTPIIDAFMWEFETSGSAPEEPPVEPPSTDKKIFLRGD